MAEDLAKKNRNFLQLYEPYIQSDWKAHYFAYDSIKVEYKTQKTFTNANVVQLDQIILLDVKRVDLFLSSLLNDIEHELNIIEGEDSCDHSIELVVRKTYERCTDCERFFELNVFAMLKTIKKLQKLMTGSSLLATTSISKEFVDEIFKRNFVKIDALKSRCVDLYTIKFCRNYPILGTGELKFVKNKERTNPQTPFLLSFKFGLSVAIVLLLVADCYLGDDNMLVDDQNWFWNNPGLYVYTSVGNLLVFRMTWAANLVLWNRFGINYIPIFQFSDNKPNMMIVFDHVSTQLLLFTGNLLIFYEANKASSIFFQVEFFRNGLPMLLLVPLFIIYEAWEYYLYGNSYRLSRGVFSYQSLKNCVMTPFVKVTFRDNYVANVLTSFTKVFSDFFYAACWIICGGAFLHSSSRQSIDHFGNETAGLSCTGTKMGVVILVSQLIPQWMRFGQNLRQYQDTGLMRYPWNMFKYVLTMVVLLYGYFHDEYDANYIILVAAVALYKWWWDVVMNWGLFDLENLRFSSLFFVFETTRADNRATTSRNNSSSNRSSNGDDSASSSIFTAYSKPTVYFGLRKQLMFPYPIMYYACIIANLVLRFLWVISLLPPNVSRVFVGSKLEFFLAAMEIVRRAMWGLLKTEYEHIRYVLARKPGFYLPRAVQLTSSLQQSAQQQQQQQAMLDDQGVQNDRRKSDIEVQLMMMNSSDKKQEEKKNQQQQQPTRNSIFAIDHRASSSLETAALLMMEMTTAKTNQAIMKAADGEEQQETADLEKMTEKKKQTTNNDDKNEILLSSEEEEDIDSFDSKEEDEDQDQEEMQEVVGCMMEEDEGHLKDK